MDNIPLPLKWAIGIIAPLIAITIALSWAAETNLAGYTTIRQMPTIGKKITKLCFY